MRAPFNSSMVFWAQSSGIVADLPYTGPHPCRFVPQEHVFPFTFPWSERIAWVTYTASPPLTPISSPPGLWTRQYWGDVDLVEVEEFPGVLWVPVLTEQIIPHVHPSYFRTWLAPRWWEGMGASVPAVQGPPQEATWCGLPASPDTVGHEV